MLTSLPVHEFFLSDCAVRNTTLYEFVHPASLSTPPSSSTESIELTQERILRTFNHQVHQTMSRDADALQQIEAASAVGAHTGLDPRRGAGPSAAIPPRMQYRSRPVSVAVDPVSLVMSECISITSAIHKHARSPHSSVSAILGGNPNPIHLGPPSPSSRGAPKTSGANLGIDGSQDVASANRWGLRGKKGRSIQDNPLMAGFGKLRHELASVRGRIQTPSHFASLAGSG